MKNRPDWIATYSGKSIKVLTPDPNLICIEDIIAGMLNERRFKNLTKQPWTVLRHSVFVALMAQAANEPPEVVWGCLMHDATEAFLSDVITPVKQFIPEYERIEGVWNDAIGTAFGVPITVCEKVKMYDFRAFVAEAYLLTRHPECYDLPPIDPSNLKAAGTVIQLITDTTFADVFYKIYDPSTKTLRQTNTSVPDRSPEVGKVDSGTVPSGAGAP